MCYKCNAWWPQVPHQVWIVQFNMKPVVWGASVTAAAYMLWEWWTVIMLRCHIIVLSVFWQGPPLGQCAGQTNQAKEGELPPKWSSPLPRNQRGAGPHHWLLSLQTRNRSDFVVKHDILWPKQWALSETWGHVCSLQMIWRCPVILQMMRSSSLARGITSLISTD